MQLLQIGFLTVRIWDILDILIVGYLAYQAYRLLKDSIAVNIFIGILLLLGTLWVVNALEMTLLNTILRAFTSVGVVALVVIFQPELRRFLLYIGNTTLQRRFRFLNLILNRDEIDNSEVSRLRAEIHVALQQLGTDQVGALIVVTDAPTSLPIASQGIILQAEVSRGLICSIFQKESPLHDGAVIIANGKLLSACAVMPLSENPSIPQWAGLRHRAAIGITEVAEVAAFVVSEETGNISFAQRGVLYADLSSEELQAHLDNVFQPTN